MIEASIHLMQIFGLGWGEILLLVLIALLLFGPRKLPELARSAGEAVREFRKASSALTEEPIKEEKKEKTIEELRELAMKLGIDVEGKSEEQLLKEIKEALESKGGSSST